MMRAKIARTTISIGLVLTLSCGDARPKRETAESAALGGEIAARVGGETIPLSLVAAVAAEQRVTPEEALRRLVDDAIAASAARERGLDKADPAAWRIVAARARMTADKIHAEAKAAGPPTDAEIRELSERYWQEVDRPPAVRVVHALVKRPKGAPPDVVAEARLLAATMHDALSKTTSTEEFKGAAKALPHAPTLEIHAEDLPAFTEDGWQTEGQGRMDETFSRAAYAIPAAGDTSGVVETSFGWHVIRLVERIPERRMPLDVRRVTFVEEAYKMRGALAVDAKLAQAKRSTPVTISPSAEELMRSVIDTGSGPSP